MNPGPHGNSTPAEFPATVGSPSGLGSTSPRAHLLCSSPPASSIGAHTLCDSHPAGHGHPLWVSATHELTTQPQAWLGPIAPCMILNRNQAQLLAGADRIRGPWKTSKMTEILTTLTKVVFLRAHRSQAGTQVPTSLSSPIPLHTAGSSSTPPVGFLEDVFPQ